MTVARAKAWRAAGTEQLVFACGQAACAQDARLALARAKRGGLTTRLALALGRGHSYTDPVARRAAESAGWAPSVAADAETE